MATAAYKRRQAIRLARATAEEFQAALKEGKALTKLAAKEKIDVEETGDFTQSYSPFVPRIGTSEELADAAFALTEDQTVIDGIFEIQNRFVLATVKSRQAADLAELDETKRSELREAILSRKKTEAVQQKIDALRATSVIVIAPNVQALLDEEK
jgi:peptidyl-prolyl cis-trans isomerase D